MSDQTYNPSNTTNLGQLKRAAERSHDEVTSLAGIVYGVLEDMILQADITVPTSAWGKNDDAETLAEGYAYKASALVSKLIENSNVNVTLSAPSLTIAAKARMCKTVNVAEGSLTFYAKSIPTAAISARLDAIQLDDSEET